MKGWRTQTLGDVCHVYQPETIAQKALRPGPYPVYGANGQIGWHDTPNHQASELLLGCRGSVGAIHKTTGPAWINGNAMVVRPLAGVIDQDFLAYALGGGIDITAAITGAAQPQITRSSLSPISVSYPVDINDQRRIVAVLDEAFEAIAMAKSNTEKNLQNARALFDGHLSDVFQEPKLAWRQTVVEQHIRFIDYRGKTPEKTSQGLRLITAKNVKKGFIQEEPREFVAPESYEGWMTRGIPKLGDVLFTTEAPLGNVAQLDTAERVVFAQRIIIMQPDPAALDSTFLKYLLLSEPMQAKLRARATGATAQGIKASLLKRIPITFPKTLKDQAAIVERLDSLAEATRRLEDLYVTRLAALDELKKVLLSRAFSGALTDKAAEEQVAEVA